MKIIYFKRLYKLILIIIIEVAYTSFSVHMNMIKDVLLIVKLLNNVYRATKDLSISCKGDYLKYL